MLQRLFMPVAPGDILCLLSGTEPQQLLRVSTLGLEFDLQFQKAGLLLQASWTAKHYQDDRSESKVQSIVSYIPSYHHATQSGDGLDVKEKDLSRDVLVIKFSLIMLTYGANASDILYAGRGRIL